MRRLLSGLLAAALVLVASPAIAQDNTSVVVNTKDGSSLFDLSFAIHRVAGDVVDQTNAAVAFASCEECQTVAIAIQVVLVTGDAEVVSPENYALAINQLCTLCETLATAYQIVLGTGGPVRFTPEGQRELVRIRLALLELMKGEFTIEQIQARVAELVTDLKTVLAEHLVPAGRPPDATPSPSGTTSAPSESASPSDSPSASPSATEESASPTPTATVTP